MTSPLEIDIDPAPVKFSGLPANSPPEILVLPVQGQQGDAGESFNHTQASASASWIINHNLNTYPSVSVRIDDELVIADVAYGSLNQVTITFASPQTGTAHLV
jgi:hypothetical protein